MVRSARAIRSRWTSLGSLHLRAEMPLAGELARAGRLKPCQLPPAGRVRAARAGRSPVPAGDRTVPQRGLRWHGPQHHHCPRPGIRPTTGERNALAGRGAGFRAGAASGHAEHHTAGRGIARGSFGFAWDEAAAQAWVICSGGSRKAAHVRAGSRPALCQVDGGHWLTMTTSRIDEDPETIREAERRYAARYRTPRVNPRRVCLIVSVGRVLGSA